MFYFTYLEGLSKSFRVLDALYAELDTNYSYLTATVGFTPRHQRSSGGLSTPCFRGLFWVGFMLTLGWFWGFGWRSLLVSAF